MFKYTVSLVAVLTLFITACGGDEADNWVGTWTMQSADGQNFDQPIEEEGISMSITTNEWTFTDDGKVDAVLTFKAEGQEDGLDLSIEATLKITGTYTLSGDTYTLTLKTEGEGDIFVDEAGTGTWARDGSTLTLNEDDGSTIIFKKK